MNEKTTIHLVIQRKGGAGKSMFTILNALKFDSKGLLDSQKKKNGAEKMAAAFFDADNETYTLSKKVNFLKGKTPSVLYVENLTDEKASMVRDKLLYAMKGWAEMPFEEVYIDFGAGESSQLAHMIDMDYPIEQIKQYAEHIGANLVFDIIVAGGDNFSIHVNYMKKIVDLTKGLFEVNIWVNEHTFYQQLNLIDEIKEYQKVVNDEVPGSIAEVRLFGGFDLKSTVTSKIINNLALGIPFKEFDFLSKMKLESEFLKLK